MSSAMTGGRWFSRCLAATFVLLLMAPVLIAGETAKAKAACASSKGAGGEWLSFGQDLSNSRSQPKEDKITPETAPLLLTKWTSSIAEAGGSGNFQSTPVIADGCLYAGTSAGWIFAFNADTGDLVWKTRVSKQDSGLGSGAYSLLAAQGKIYANVNARVSFGTAIASPFVAALDATTGKILWKTVVTTDRDAYTNSSPALIDGMIFMGISGPEDSVQDDRHPGGYAFVDADTGKLVHREYLVNKKDDDRGLKGVSVWTTPVFDPKTGYAYAGTGQPANKAREATLSNSIIKIDADRSRSTFGHVVDWYRGDYDDGADLDFGGSPSLFTDKDGRTIVAALQKSGKFHAVFADTMDQAWWARLALPAALGNSSTAAVDKSSVYITANSQTGVTVEAPNPGYLYALNRNNGNERWRAPVAGGVEYHLISEAGGIVYVVTTHGVLLGFDASNGLPVVVRSLSADTGDGCVNLASGVAIARHKVYAVCDLGAAGGGWIVAYGL